MIEIRREALDSPQALALIAALNAEMSAMYPEPGATHFSLRPEQVAQGNGAFLVAYQGTRPVGCGALRLIAVGVGELKRMYVVRPERGTGVGRAILRALELEARKIGIRRLVLETGVRQLAALSLYERAGFTPIPVYGEYVNSKGTSVCLAKDLDGDPYFLLPR